MLTPTQARLPRFQGLTHNLRGRHWLSEDALARALSTSKTPYLGSLPTPLLGVCPGDPKRTLAFFDQWASDFRAKPWDEQTTSLHQWQTRWLDETGQALKLKYMGSGSFGFAFMIKTQDAQGEKHRYVLKVFKDREPDDFSLNQHGKIAENSAGVYLSKWNFKDLGKYYCGNPHAGWSLVEFIDNDAKAETRKGIELSKKQVRHTDTHNQKGGVLFEYGGLVPGIELDEDNPEETVRLFYKGLKNPRVAPDMVRQLSALPDDEKMKAFGIAMASPHLRRIASERLHILPDKQKALAFHQAMAYADCRKNAFASLVFLPKKDRFPALQEAMQYPECQKMGHEWVIASLPRGLRKQAFDLMLPYVEMSLIMVQQIKKLPWRHRKAARAALDAIKPQTPEEILAEVRAQRRWLQTL